MSLRDGNNGRHLVEAMAGDPNNPNTLAGFYIEAYAQLQGILRANASTMYQKDRAQLMLKRVNEAVQKMDAETKRMIERDVPFIYKKFGNEARAMIKEGGLDVPKEFSSVHIEAAQAMADDAYNRFGMTLQGVQKSAQDYVRLAGQEAIRKKIAGGIISGTDQKEIAKAVQGVIDDQGITALIDKGGKKWKLDTYATMLSKQIMADASRDATRNNAEEFGFDLVQISRHNAEDQCREWEGKIMSLSGATPGYETIEHAKGIHLFHVNCKHGYNVVIPGARQPRLRPVKQITTSSGKEIQLHEPNVYRAMTSKERKSAAKSGFLEPHGDEKRLYMAPFQELAELGAVGPNREFLQGAQPEIVRFSASALPHEIHDDDHMPAGVPSFFSTEKVPLVNAEYSTDGGDTWKPLN